MLNKSSRRKSGRRGIFNLWGLASERQDPAGIKFEVQVVGYTKPEDDHWVAICTNLGLVSQGETDDVALNRLIDSVEAYAEFLFSEYPDNWEEVIASIVCPNEFIEEYQGIAKRISEYADSIPFETENAHTTPTVTSLAVPQLGTTFVKSLSPA